VIADVKLAQTFYFYGSLIMMYFLVALFVVIVATNGFNALSPENKALAVACTVVDPSFAFVMLLLFQHNFFAARSFQSGHSVLDIEIGGGMLATLVIMSIVYLVTLIYLETGFEFLKSSGSATSAAGVSTTELHDNSEFSGLDQDVAQEKQYVHQVCESHTLDKVKNAIFVQDLNKIYYGRGTVPTKRAVKDLCLNVQHGEVFGLLGANGAGKSTTLKMVSGLESPSDGSAYVNGFDVVSQRANAQRSMGLCPQFDTLIERLSVRENLLFFGFIKGLDNSCVVEITNAFMDALNIRKYQNKLIQNLSGGNRRKVSLAVALLGAPPTVYLDEPSTGLDPVASRLMWRLLTRVASTKTTAIVLTTHNMLECEAVCTRVGIMKNGELVVIGDSQHLRSTHGTGFLLEIAIADVSKMEDVKKFVGEHFANSVIVDEHQSIINYEVPKESVAKLSEAFGCIETRKTELTIIDYALSQSTLEQVFLKQIRPNEAEKKAQSKPKCVPTVRDYVLGYLVFLLALFIPGLHHVWLGNRWRAAKYFFTANEVYVGYFLDIFEFHQLLEMSVEEFGNTRSIFCCFQRAETKTVMAVHDSSLDV